jgi:hypothetical protein
MAVVNFSITYQGKTRTVKDWIVTGWHKPKIKAIAKALGRDGDLAAGTFRLGLLGGTAIRVCLSLKNDAEYGWQNRVDAYMETGLGMGPDIISDLTRDHEYVSYENPNDAPF